MDYNSVFENISELTDRVRTTKPNSKNIRVFLLEICNILQHINSNTEEEDTNYKTIKLTAVEANYTYDILNHHIEVLQQVLNYACMKKLPTEDSLEKELMILKAVSEKLKNI